MRARPIASARYRPRIISRAAQRFTQRLRCLGELKDLGYQVGSGNIVGLKGQSLKQIARDILFFQENDFDMIGIGPFIPHQATALAAGVLLFLVGLRWPLLLLFALAALIPVEEAGVIGDLGTLSKAVGILFAVVYALPRLGRLRLTAMPAAIPRRRGTNHAAMSAMTMPVIKASPASLVRGWPRACIQRT